MAIHKWLTNCRKFLRTCYELTGVTKKDYQHLGNMLLLRVLPFIIGDWIDMECEQWKVIEKPPAISSLLVAPVIHEDIDQRLSF